MFLFVQLDHLLGEEGQQVVDDVALVQLQVVGDELQHAGVAFGEAALVEGAAFGGELGATITRGSETIRLIGNLSRY